MAKIRGPLPMFLLGAGLALLLPLFDVLGVLVALFLTGAATIGLFMAAFKVIPLRHPLLMAALGFIITRLTVFLLTAGT